MATSLIASTSSALRLASRLAPLRASGAGSPLNTQLDILSSESPQSSLYAAQQSSECTTSTSAQREGRRTRAGAASDPLGNSETARAGGNGALKRRGHEERTPMTDATALELDSPFHVADSSPAPRFGSIPSTPRKRRRQSAPRLLLHSVTLSGPRTALSSSSQIVMGNQQRLVHSGLLPQDRPTARNIDASPSLDGSHRPSALHQPPPIPKQSFSDVVAPEVMERMPAEPDMIRTKSQPRMDELNTLLRHPTLYDPVCVPRFPIVLCHGLYGFDVRGPAFFRLHYWGDLLRILRGKIGAECFVTAVPGTGAIKQRAHALHQYLEDMPEVQGRDLNFVGHSMGGLDARYLFSNIRPTTYNPRSLTTLSTPHRGSEFMAWCRANIGIGTDFDEMSTASARATHEEIGVPMPFSLKNPILSRAQVEAAKRASEARKLERQAVEEIKRSRTFSAAAALGGKKIPGLPYSLSTSLSSYLLDLLDSPAYTNLTPAFLDDVFNPATPDRSDINYYSIAARTPKISVLHPLWLPKLVLDGAESARAAKGLKRDPANVGNDGLVSIESAKWGTFLGTLDNCDHWELRGSSGLIDEAKKAKEAAKDLVVPNAAQTLENASMRVKSWQWQDVYALVGKPNEKSSSPKIEGGSPVTTSTEKPTPSPEQNSETRGIASLASWITRQLPNSPSIPLLPAVIFAGGPTSPPLPSSTSSPSVLTSAASNEARMLYGSPTSVANIDKFDLERMCFAICRKLHDEGL